MIALIQRVSRAAVCVEQQTVGAIEGGLLAFIGIVREDDAATGERLLRRVLDYRVFPDAAGRMNLSLRDVAGGLLLVPQFTLAADTARGNRPGFSLAAEPAQAAVLFEHLLSAARASYHKVAAGRFGARMQVSLINDGPVTFWLESAAARPGAAAGH
jgi:D-aminoacyl-tRNA deacylase